MSEPVYQRIYLVVRQIPAGQVATYGQVASIVGGCTARMVGYAMASLPEASDVPWQRVINAQGRISPRGDQGGSIVQRLRLEDEGVHFGLDGKVEWSHVRWPGPPIEWLLEHGFAPGPHWSDEWRGDGLSSSQPSLFSES